MAFDLPLVVSVSVCRQNLILLLIRTFRRKLQIWTCCVSLLFLCWVFIRCVRPDVTKHNATFQDFPVFLKQLSEFECFWCGGTKEFISSKTHWQPQISGLNFISSERSQQLAQKLGSWDRGLQDEEDPKTWIYAAMSLKNMNNVKLSKFVAYFRK